MTTPDNCSPVTRAVRAGIATDAAFGAVTPPVVLSSTFSFEAFGKKRAYDYSRSGNPTRDLLGDTLADLEGGAGGVVTPSGMAAVTLATSLLSPGDRVIVPHDFYGGCWRLFQALARKGHFSVVTIDFTDEAQLVAALAEPTKVVWIETPSNPLLRITDIARVAELSHAAGAIVVADNTFLSPALQRPLALGADVVVHSTTKYLNGHSDVVGGAVIAKDAALHEELAWWANALGVTGSPFDSFLTLRGIRTLDARLRVHQENAGAIAEQLWQHPAVATVYYPGLPTHPGHELARRQQRGFGAMLSLELRGGEPAARAFVGALECFTLAESLGGIESLVAHPATMTHLSMSPEARAVAGISDGLLRLSVGIEALNDLQADLAAGIAAAEAAVGAASWVSQ